MSYVNPIKMPDDWHPRPPADRVINRLVADGLTADGPCLNAGCQEWARTEIVQGGLVQRVVERGCDHASCTRYGSKR